jgi:16S rRNA (cytosine1402-N4)-methyltransferase
VPTFFHIPVLMEEVLTALQPRDGGCYADGTVGGGGHAEAILRRSAPGGRLVGFDRDGEAMDATRVRLADFAGRFELHRANFGDLADWLPAESCDGVLLDLGVSSPQLDRPERGFSFQQDGPLDMRQDQQQALTAADLVNTLEAGELADVFWKYGGERQSRRLARVIERERAVRRIETTRALAELVERAAPRHGGRTHPATQIFQALRMVVNDEIGSLRKGLDAVLKVLKPGGRLVVITFHSLEDRVVKAFGREMCRDYVIEGEVDVPELRRPRPSLMRWVERKGVRATPDELALNPRSRSAQLRVLQKT